MQGPGSFHLGSDARVSSYNEVGCASLCPFSTAACDPQARGSGGCRLRLEWPALQEDRGLQPPLCAGARPAPHLEKCSLYGCYHSTPVGLLLGVPPSAHIRFHSQDCTSSVGTGFLPPLPSNFQAFSGYSPQCFPAPVQPPGKSLLPRGKTIFSGQQPRCSCPPITLQ